MLEYNRLMSLFPHYINKMWKKQEFLKFFCNWKNLDKKTQTICKNLLIYLDKNKNM